MRRPRRATSRRNGEPSIGEWHLVATPSIGNIFRRMGALRAFASEQMIRGMIGPVSTSGWARCSAFVMLLSRVLAPASAGAQSCDFQSHAIQPPIPSALVPFEVSASVLGSCGTLLLHGPPEIGANVVAIEVDCSCIIGTPPPPVLQTVVFPIPGLSAGNWTVEFYEDLAAGPLVVDSVTFGVEPGPAAAVPALGTTGAVVLAGLLLIVGALRIRTRA